MKCEGRNFISVYFPSAGLDKRARRDVTLAFREDDELFLKCRGLGSSTIREIVGISSYEELLEGAKQADRTPSNFVKHKLRLYFFDE